MATPRPTRPTGLVGPQRPKKRRRATDAAYGAHIDDLSPDQRVLILNQMCADYASSEDGQIETCDERILEDLRVRVDGQPSARQPAATMPLSYWAVIEDAPDGGDVGTVENVLAWYKAHLRMWRAKGLYDGPTELTYVNREESDEP